MIVSEPRVGCSREKDTAMSSEVREKLRTARGKVLQLSGSHLGSLYYKYGHDGD